jgi:hypothetical protein
MSPPREVALATLAMAVWLFVADQLAHWPWLAPHAGALVAAGFLGVPLLVAYWRKLPGDLLRLDGALRPAVAWGLAASLVILPVFALGHDLVLTRVWHASRTGPGLASPGLDFQDDAGPQPGRVVLVEDARGLALRNETAHVVQVMARHVAPGGRVVLAPGTVGQLTVTSADGQPVPVVAGQGVALTQPIDATPGYGWLGWLLASQLLVVALPEEAFFRGYVLSRLRSVWQPRRRLWGVPFGQAHVVSAALFALVHLVAVPHPGRLLVFFPALVFAWLGERTRGALAPAVHHALCNVALRLLQRFYA